RWAGAEVLGAHVVFGPKTGENVVVRVVDPDASDSKPRAGRHVDVERIGSLRIEVPWIDVDDDRRSGVSRADLAELDLVAKPVHVRPAREQMDVARDGTCRLRRIR